jgi:hypothetical protein
MFADPPPTPALSPYSNQSLGALFDPTPSGVNPFGALSNIVMPPRLAPATPPRNALHDLVAPPALPYSKPYFPPPKPVVPETKRKAFFSFYYKDIMRVNNVRNAWKITHPDNALNRSFYDSSLWESRQLVNEEALKKLIRAGVLYTSTVCVLAGTDTWERRWVRYEIARAIIDGRGLLTVHLNNLPHHQSKTPHVVGYNPLAFMGIAKLQRNPRLPPQYFLYEKNLVPDGYGGLVEQWRQYPDHTAAVKKPAWLRDPSLDHVMPLSANAAEYDYVHDHGHRNIGSWIDKAAKQAGR